MATTYTTNFHLGMQANTADKFDMSVITDNMPIIDAALSKSVPTVTATISNTTLADFHEGVVTGVVAAEITGDTDMYGVVRAYIVNQELEAYMQICELWNGSRLTRHYLNGSWSSWE